MKFINWDLLSKRKYAKLDVPCMYTQIGNPSDGFDYECGYEKAPPNCESCVCNVETYGTINPMTGKQVNWFLRKIQWCRHNHFKYGAPKKKGIKRTVYKEEAPKVLFLCNRKACVKCSNDLCSHTTDIKYACNFEMMGDFYIEREM